MNFAVRPTLSSCASMVDFLKEYGIGDTDLIITNEYVLLPALKGEKLPCDVVLQEKYGNGEPTDAMVDAMLAERRDKKYNRVIGIGGGTVLDIAKLFVFGNELRCKEIFAKGELLQRENSLLLIPTTCGTGSEVTNISIVNFVEKGTKIGLAVPALYADSVVLIAELLNTMPYPVFAHASIDALIHAMESYVSPKSTTFTRAMGRGAIEIIIAGYRNLVSYGKRELPGTNELMHFLEASTMAGIAFGNAGCGAVHALSYPIGSIYHVPHGKSNYLLLEGVFTAYRNMGADISALEKTLSEILQEPLEKVWRTLFALLAQIEDLQQLGDLGIDAKQCKEMAANVIANQQRLLANTPQPLSEKQIEDIYLSCL